MNPAHVGAIIFSLMFSMVFALVDARVRILIPLPLFFLSIALASGQAEVPVPSASASVESPVIVIGFVGGFVRHDNFIHSEVQLAAHLRNDYPSGVHAEVFENHSREKAHGEVLRLLDTNRDGTLSADERQGARIIIYGHSWGASETVALARELEGDSIPVLLTIQVDSVSKTGQNDTVIPANVTESVNFYQLAGFLHGAPKIRAANALRTQILGNFRFDYKASPVRCDLYPWLARVFMKSHIEIECDPRVWNQVNSLIRSKLPPVIRNTPSQAPIISRGDRDPVPGS